MDTTNTVFDEIQDWVKGQGLDIELLVDVSGSMKNENRKDQAMEFAKTAAQVANLVDEDGGVGLVFFSDYPSDQSYQDVPAAQVQAKFDTVQIGGSTDTLKFIEAEVKRHYERKKGKPDQRTMVIVITDGEPNGGAAGKAALKKYLAELQPKINFTEKVPELKIVFAQVGTDTAATAFLKDMDNDNAACGLLVYTVYTGKDNRSIAEVFRDALREHKLPN